MVDLGTTLFHHLFQVPIAERIGQVTTDTEQDDIFFETVTLKVDHAEARGANRWARSLPKSKTSPLTQQNRTNCLVSLGRNTTARQNLNRSATQSTRRPASPPSTQTFLSSLQLPGRLRSRS